MIEFARLFSCQRLPPFKSNFFALLGGVIHQSLHLRRFISLAIEDVIARLLDQLLTDEVGLVIRIAQAFANFVWVVTIALS